MLRPSSPKPFWLALSMLLLAIRAIGSPVAAAPQTFLLTGRVFVSNSDDPITGQQNLVVIVDNGITIPLTLKESEFQEQIPTQHESKYFAFIFNHSDLVVLTTEPFRPREAYVGNERKVYKVIHLIRRSGKIAALLNSADLALESSPQKALGYVREAESISVTRRSLMLKANLIREFIKHRSEIPRDIAFLHEEFEYSSFHQECQESEDCLAWLAKFYRSLGDALSSQKDLSDKVSNYDTYLDVIERVYNKSIDLDPTESKSYQGKYLAQLRTQNYMDVTETIKSFFSKKPEN